MINVMDSEKKLEENFPGFKIIPMDISKLDKANLMDECILYIYNILLKQRCNRLLCLYLDEETNSVVDIEKEIIDAGQAILNYYVADPNILILNMIPLDIYLNHGGSVEANMALELFSGLQFQDLEFINLPDLYKYIMVYINREGGELLTRNIKFD